MHLYLITRGIKNEVDALIQDLQAQYFPYMINGQLHYVQLGVRPIQLWEMVLPEDQMPTLLRTLWDAPPSYDGGFKIKALASSMRKILGAKKIPEIDYSKVMPRIVRNYNVGKIPIGVKYDKFDEEKQRENL